MNMKKIIRYTAAVLCALLAVVAFASCGKGKETEIEREEVPEGSVWVFSTVEAIEAVVSGDVKETVSSGSTDENNESSIYAGVIYDQHNVIRLDDSLQMQQIFDRIEFNEGKVYLRHCRGEGNPSFMSGREVYRSYTETVTEIGTYSGAEISVTYGDYTDAYISEGRLVLRSVASDGGEGYTCDAIFLPASEG